MVANGLSVIFQVYYSEDIGGFDMNIVEVNGRFEAVGLIQLLKNCAHHNFSQVQKALEKKDDTSWDVETEVRYAEPETQYGSGYGDVLTLPGYYYICDVIKVVEHPKQDEGEE